MFNWRNFDLSIILRRIGWHLAYNLSLRDLDVRLRDGTRRSTDPIRICKGNYLLNRIVQDGRCIMRRVRSVLFFKSITSGRIILDGIEMVHMMRKR